MTVAAHPVRLPLVAVAAGQVTCKKVRTVKVIEGTIQKNELDASGMLVVFDLKHRQKEPTVFVSTHPMVRLDSKAQFAANARRLPLTALSPQSEFV